MEGYKHPVPPHSSNITDWLSLRMTVWSNLSSWTTSKKLFLALCQACVQEALPPDNAKYRLLLTTCYAIWFYKEEKTFLCKKILILINLKTDYIDSARRCRPERSVSKNGLQYTANVSNFWCTCMVVIIVCQFYICATVDISWCLNCQNYVCPAQNSFLGDSSKLFKTQH